MVGDKAVGPEGAPGRLFLCSLLYLHWEEDLSEVRGISQAEAN